MDSLNKAKFNFKKIILIFSCIAALGTGIYLYNNRNSDVIQDYNPQKDRQFILDIFKDNWYWLVASTDFSAEHMLDYRASSKQPQNIGNLTIKTYYHDKQPTGFVAYYTKALYEGWILFLAVDTKYRSQGYARKMLQYAIDDLIKRGSTIIRLITRTNNERGKKLYTGMGFKQVWTDGEFIKFEKPVK